jgi:hypothetical protein
MSGVSTSGSGTVQSVQYAAPSTGATVTANAGVHVLHLDPAGTLAALSVVLPASPANGQDFVISTSQTITALTITGTIVGTLTTLALGGFARFNYSSSAAKWLRAG